MHETASIPSSSLRQTLEDFHSWFGDQSPRPLSDGEHELTLILSDVRHGVPQSLSLSINGANGGAVEISGWVSAPDYRGARAGLRTLEGIELDESTSIRLAIDIMENFIEASWLDVGGSSAYRKQARRARIAHGLRERIFAELSLDQSAEQLALSDEQGYNTR